MNTPTKVTGSECLNYINRPIGLACKCWPTESLNDYINAYERALQTNIYPYNWYNIIVKYWGGGNGNNLVFHIEDNVTCIKFDHDTNKRIIGLVNKKYSDGGYYITLLGNETLHTDQCKYIGQQQEVTCQVEYKHDDLLSNSFVQDTPPKYTVYDGGLGSDTTAISRITEYYDTVVPFDDSLDYQSKLRDGSNINYWFIDKSRVTNGHITNNPNTTFHIGEGREGYNIQIEGELMGDPLAFLQGNLYQWQQLYFQKGLSLMRKTFDNALELHSFQVVTGDEIDNFNLTCIQYNIILTESLQFAQDYLSNGTLPPDAFLFPLDWSNLPTWDGDNPDDNPEDFPNGNDPDDNERDVTPNLPQVPSFTPAMLSNYNWYWLQVGEYASFIDWFWNDIGSWSDFGDFVQTIMGLYNDLASAILMVRYFPVDVSWIGGTGTQSKIIVGMIEQDNSLVDTISQASPPPVRDIGHIKIDERYKSFIDLTPYTQLSIYLPFYGFVDMDIDILMGHSLYVKGIYDYLTGTIQYLLYYDNQVLINSFVAKFAVDIPISLQTKNDRDNAIFSNVLSALGGAVGVAGGIASGNPVGMALGATQGVQSMMGASASAPLNVKGTVGETGALYAPPQCAIILRRPTIQSSDKGASLTTWKHNIGQLCGYGYTLKNLQGAGFTTCHTPRINFRSTVPMRQEIDEIYSYLESGVIL